MKLSHLVCFACALVSAGGSQATPLQPGSAPAYARPISGPVDGKGVGGRAERASFPTTKGEELVPGSARNNRLHRRRHIRRRAAIGSVQPEPPMEAPYRPGHTYFLRTNPGFLTAIALAPGEKVISKASGDTRSWALGETSEGEGATLRPIILLKPAASGLRTNIVLATDRRLYLLVAESARGRRFTDYFSWTYPTAMSASGPPAPPRAPLSATGAAAANGSARALFPFVRLNFGYRISPNAHREGPAWRPTRAFDDGVRTYIQFPQAFSQMIAPPLFESSKNGTVELINYHVAGRYYITDRLIDRAVLKYG